MIHLDHLTVVQDLLRLLSQQVLHLRRYLLCRTALGWTLHEGGLECAGLGCSCFESRVELFLRQGVVFVQVFSELHEFKMLFIDVGVGSWGLVDEAGAEAPDYRVANPLHKI